MRQKEGCSCTPRVQMAQSLVHSQDSIDAEVVPSIQSSGSSEGASVLDDGNSSCGCVDVAADEGEAAVDGGAVDGLLMSSS